MLPIPKSTHKPNGPSLSEPSEAGPPGIVAAPAGANAGSSLVPAIVPLPAPAAHGADAADDGADEPAARLHQLAEMRHDPAAIRRIFETGEYPTARACAPPPTKPTCWTCSANC